MSASDPAAKLGLTYRLLTAVALVILMLAYSAPIWWVSLEAPQFPKSAFPDGVRIHFHFDGVENGCTNQVSDEVEYGEGLDCVEEMDTINHYIGMAPTSAGGPIERGMSKFSFAILGLMLVAFMLPRGRNQILLLAGGYIAIEAGLIYYLYGPPAGLDAINAGFIDGMSQFFRDKEKIAAEGEALKRNAGIVVAAYAVIMIAITFAVAKFKADMGWVLALVPALMPLIFIIDYAAWLYWFGHSLHPWGAFTVKAFMPTVFGDGKVAQFTTHSYPHYGWFMLVVQGVLLLLAILIRRKMMRIQNA